MNYGDWLTLPASAEMDFDREPYDVWEEAMKQLHERKRFFPHQPPNPEWN